MNIGRRHLFRISSKISASALLGLAVFQKEAKETAGCGYHSQHDGQCPVANLGNKESAE